MGPLPDPFDQEPRVSVTLSARELGYITDALKVWLTNGAGPDDDDVESVDALRIRLQMVWAETMTSPQRREETEPVTTIEDTTEANNDRGRFLIDGAVRGAVIALQSVLPAAESLDADPGPYHRLAAVLEALRGILGDVERT
jgi:hypothetical protein